MTLEQVPLQAAKGCLTAADFRDVPYSPALLLESRFDASITDDDEFAKGCAWGFDAYFEEMFQWNETRTELVFVQKAYTWAEVVSWLIEGVLTGDEPASLTSRAWRAGFLLGWLSALALTRRPMALLGLEVLHALIVPVSLAV